MCPFIHSLRLFEVWSRISFSRLKEKGNRFRGHISPRDSCQCFWVLSISFKQALPGRRRRMASVLSDLCVSAIELSPEINKCSLLHSLWCSFIFLTAILVRRVSPPPPLVLQIFLCCVYFLDWFSYTKFGGIYIHCVSFVHRAYV